MSYLQGFRVSPGTSVPFNDIGPGFEGQPQEPQVGDHEDQA
jgi:hypothetical protein